MRVNTERTAGVPASTMAALMLGVFTASVGFGVALRLCPILIEQLLGPGVEAAQVSRHTGLVTAVNDAPSLAQAGVAVGAGKDVPMDLSDKNERVPTA